MTKDTPASQTYLCAAPAEIQVLGYDRSSETKVHEQTVKHLLTSFLETKVIFSSNLELL